LDTNHIFCKLMKNKTKGEMINAYQQMVNRMKLSALGLKHHRLNNKCSANFKECITKNRMTHKLAPPDYHCRNIAKRAIKTFKNYFLSILSRVDNRFPLSLWYHLVQTSGTYRQPPTTEQCRTKSVHICPCPRTTQLHDTSVCAPGMRGDGPRQAQE
jgi:hypothetical protein